MVPTWTTKPLSCVSMHIRHNYTMNKPMSHKARSLSGASIACPCRLGLSSLIHRHCLARGQAKTSMQVLAASVVDMLQAGIHQPHPEAPGKSAATPGLVQSGFEGARTGNTQPSSQASGAASLLADGAGPSRTSSLPQSADPGPESPPERSCIFEVEVVLTATGTKLTPSISQFLVCHPYTCSGGVVGICHLPSPLMAQHMHGRSNWVRSLHKRVSLRAQ